MAKIGKPPLEITDEIVEKAESLAARGLTIEQIASCLGIGERTLYEKKAMYPHLAQAIKRGSDKGISIVANALYESAKSGDKTAQIFYLKCRAHWKETTVNEVHLTKQEDSIDHLK